VWQAEDRHGSMEERMVTLEQNLQDKEMELQRVSACWQALESNTFFAD
jgi:hypothetical protein